MSDIDFRNMSDPSVRLFWFRRRLVVLGAVCAACTLGLFAYLPFSGTAALSQEVFWYEWVIIAVAAVAGVGAVLYALPWHFPGAQWAYQALAWDAVFLLVLFQMSEGFSGEARMLTTSTLILVVVVGFSAHQLDGGQRMNGNSLLFGPPP